MSDLPSPGLPRRLAAILYDTFLVLPLIMLVTALALGVRTALVGDPGDLAQAETLNARLVQLLAVLTCAGFYCGFWLIKGQTLGMQAWRIRLSSYRGERLTLSQALLRCLGALISLLPAGAGFWWCLVDRNGRYWHDYISGTELDLLPKR